MIHHIHMPNRSQHQFMPYLEHCSAIWSNAKFKMPHEFTAPRTFHASCRYSGWKSSRTPVSSIKLQWGFQKYCSPSKKHCWWLIPFNTGSVTDNPELVPAWFLLGSRKSTRFSIYWLTDNGDNNHGSLILSPYLFLNMWPLLCSGVPSARPSRF